MCREYSRARVLRENTGNNAFSYDFRSCKQLRIADLRTVHSLLDMEESNAPAFAEVEDGQEVQCPGLQHFLKWSGKDIYLFDNHNHSFYFIYRYVTVHRSALRMVHVDQHKDARRPQMNFQDFCVQLQRERSAMAAHHFLPLHERLFPSAVRSVGEEERFELLYSYTNLVLNVGNFIAPLLDERLITRCDCIDSQDRMLRFETEGRGLESEPYVLDLDLDFFSRDLDYIPWEKKAKFVASLWRKADLVTIATSPFFIEFERARNALETILKFCLTDL